MRNRQTLIVLIVAFVGAAGLLVWQNQRDAAVPPDLPAPEEVYRRMFPQITSAEVIRAVQLVNPPSGVSFAIERGEDGAWQSANAEAGETLNEGAGAQIAATVALLPFRRTLALEDGTALTEFGLDEERLTLLVNIVLTDGTGHSVAIGALSPTAEHFYALADDVPAIYLLERGAVDFLLVQLQNPPVA